MNISTPTSREIAIVPDQAALLFIDMQNFCSRPDGGGFHELDAATLRHDYGYHFDRLATVTIPNMQRLQGAVRHVGVEVMYTVI